MERHFRISLNDLNFHANHGLFPQEQAVGNEFSVSLNIIIPAINNPEDNIEKTISYADLYDVVAEEMAIPRKLLETVATAIADRFQSLFPEIISGEISITKQTPPIPSITGSATVTLSF